MGILDNVTISTSPETGQVYLVKMNAGGTKVIDKRNCEKELIKALLLNMLRGVMPGEAVSYPLKVTDPVTGISMFYDLQMRPITEQEWEQAE